MTTPLERWRVGAIAGWGSALSMLPLAAIPFVPVAGDVAAGIVAMAGAGVTGWLVRERRRIAGLPLQLAQVAARGRVSGIAVLRFRAQLGRGRRMRDPRVQVLWIPAEGARVELPVVIPVSDLCGPWTILATDEAGIVSGPGVIELTVEVQSAGRSWQAEARYDLDAVHPGWFAEGLALGRRGLEWSGQWDNVSHDSES